MADAGPFERELIVAIGGGDPRLSLVRLMPSNFIADAALLHASSFLTLEPVEGALSRLRGAEDYDYLGEALELVMTPKLKLTPAERVALLVWSARPPLVMFPAPRMIPLCVPTPHIEVDADRGDVLNGWGRCLQSDGCPWDHCCVPCDWPARYTG